VNLLIAVSLLVISFGLSSGNNVQTHILGQILYWVYAGKMRKDLRRDEDVIQRRFDLQISFAVRQVTSWIGTGNLLP